MVKERTKRSYADSDHMRSSLPGFLGKRLGIFASILYISPRPLPDRGHRRFGK
jgi:hypothetical protein